ncbi:MAG: N-acetylmuramoyl-L-alanine amidase [Candidatus Omnitrophica bacterium]|nr:N-acetylmuramoyl-L-alanine amidase [Candidatus Omnitrophota bacterium]
MKKLQKEFLILILSALVFSGCSTTPTSESFATYNVNGVSYLSLTNLCNAKGITWDYDIFARVISLSRGTHNVSFMVGDSLILVDGSAQYLSYPVDMYQGMVVVPYGFKDQVIEGVFREYVLPGRSYPMALSLKKIVIDAGHGGEDPGALGRTGLREKDVNLDIAKKLAAILREDGLEVVLTRSTDRFISLPGRISIANNANADLFVSIHSNASRTRSLNGFEVYYVAPSVNDSKRAYSSARSVPISIEHFELASSSMDLKAIIWDMIHVSNQAESVSLARKICRVMDDNSDSRIIGIKGARFAVLKGARMPAVLVETGFVSNREEEKLLRNSIYRQKVAEIIAKGILDFAQVSSTMEVAQR